MLNGTYEHTVDAKGRVFVPAKWRSDLGDTIYVTRSLVKDGDYRCLIGMSATEWLKLMENIRKNPAKDAASRESLRKFLACAFDGEVDKQGRLLLPSSLRAMAKLDGEVCLLGQANRFELWNANEWAKRMGDDDDDIGASIEYAAELGI